MTCSNFAKLKTVMTSKSKKKKKKQIQAAKTLKNVGGLFRSMALTFIRPIKPRYISYYVGRGRFTSSSLLTRFGRCHQLTWYVFTI